MKEFMKEFDQLYKAYIEGGVWGAIQASVLGLLVGIPLCLVMAAIVVKSE